MIQYSLPTVYDKKQVKTVKTGKIVLNIVTPNTQLYPISTEMINNICKVSSVYKGWHLYNKRRVKGKEVFAKPRSTNAFRKGMALIFQ